MLPEAADREIDQAGIVAGEVLVSDPDAGGDTGAKTFDEDITIPSQPSRDLDPLFVFQVKA
jgi:hypothetical protein